MSKQPRYTPANLQAHISPWRAWLGSPLTAVGCVVTAWHGSRRCLAPTRSGASPRRRILWSSHMSVTGVCACVCTSVHIHVYTHVHVNTNFYTCVRPGTTGHADTCALVHQHKPHTHAPPACVYTGLYIRLHTSHSHVYYSSIYMSIHMLRQIPVVVVVGIKRWLRADAVWPASHVEHRRAWHDTDAVAKGVTGRHRLLLLWAVDGC